VQRRIVVALFIVWVSSAPAREAPRSTAGVDSLYRAGVETMRTDEEEALRIFQEALALDPKHVPSTVKLGLIHLKQGDIDGAERMLRHAIRRNDRLAEAYNGLGLVLLRRRNQKYAAIEHFHQAVLLDPKYAEAQYNLARTHLSLEDLDAKPAFKKLIEMAPHHPDAHIHLGTIYEKEDLDYEAAIRCYEQQLKITPHHPAARRRLAALYRRTGREEEAERVVQAGGDPRTDRGRLLQSIKQYAERGETDLAMNLVDAYLAGLSPEERALYRDIRLVASPEERAEHEALPAEGRALHATRFWNRRDVTPALGVNERLLEHCRRVAYAREFFADGQQPWDRRGEVFIRYGEPDHTSRFDDVKPERDPRMKGIKDRLAYGLGDALALLLPSADPFHSQGGPTLRGNRYGGLESGGLEDRIGQVDLRTRAMDMDLRGRPVFPLRSDAPWEYWLYKDIDPGIEVVFSDDLREERYDYAPFRYDYAMKELTTKLGLNVEDVMQRYQDIQSKVVMERAAARFPDRFRSRLGPELPSGFDAADFRGEGGKTRVEFYCGASIGGLIPKKEGGKSALLLERAVAVYDSLWDRVAYLRDEVSLEVEGADRRRMMIPDAMAVELPPGTYQITFQVKDGGSRAAQVFRRRVVVESYADSGLCLSDVQLASSVTPVDRPGHFVKSGLRVTPMPVSTYMHGQAVSVYFEVYNLSADDYGLSAYDVTYRIRSEGRGGALAKALAGAGRFLGLGRQGEDVAVSFEQGAKGRESASYLTLDVAEAGPGRYLLTVEVKDRRTGATASKGVRFEVVRR